MDRWDLKVNWKKTKVMKVPWRAEVVKWGSEIRLLSRWRKLITWGWWQDGEGSGGKDCECYKNGRMSERVRSKWELSKSTKLTVVNATMVPSLLYSCEAWSLTKQPQRRVQATKMSVIRRIQRVSRLDKMRSDEIRQRLWQEDILDEEKAWELTEPLTKC